MIPIRLLPLVYLCLLGLLSCNFELGKPNSNGSSVGEGDGVAGGFGGGGKLLVKAETARHSLVLTLKALAKEGNLSFLGTGLGLTTTQAIQVNDLIVFTLEDLIRLHMESPTVELKIVDTLPDGREGQTAIGREGIIELLKSTVETGTSQELFELIAHESFHKVNFRGKFLDDLSPQGPFDGSGGSRRLIDFATEALRLYGNKKVYMTQVLAHGPLVYARLNEKSGTLAYDISGGGFNGEYVGQVTHSVSGAVDNQEDAATEFEKDGISHVKFSNVPVKTIAGSRITVEFWMRGRAGEITQTNPQMVFATGSQGSYLLGFYEGVFGLAERTGSFSIARTHGITAALSGWNHVAIVLGQTVWDPNKLYVNGALATSFAGFQMSSAWNKEFYFGAWPDQNMNFDGALDEIAIYNKQLTLTNIRSHYQLGIAGVQ